MSSITDLIKGLFQPKAKIMTTHKLKTGQTLSALALKYYGNAGKPYWTLIAQANLELVGANGRKGQPGMVLNIPELPAELKK
jgi:nucleoid-associated protein YgaU